MSSRAPDLSVVVRTPQRQIVASGPGRLLSEAYLKGGRFIGKKCNRLAHRWGHGPYATAEHILKEIQNHDGGPMRLAHFRNEVGGELDKNCMRLLKYALPTEVRGAQLKAFKNIVHLTTRFPGMRHVFLRCKRLQAAGGTKPCVIRLWVGSDTDFATDNSEWNFFLGLAASCICEDIAGVASLLENSRLDDLGYIPVNTGEYSVIEQLLVASESCDKFEPWIAIRYLGGILESPSFWEQEPHSNHRAVTKKLFKRVRQVVEDLDVERWAITDVALRVIRGDVQGIDILVSALLNGVAIWHMQEHTRPLGPLLSDFARLMALVRHPAAQYLLPQSYNTVSYDYTTLVRMTFKRESVEIVVLSESLASTSRPASIAPSLNYPHPTALRTDNTYHHADQPAVFDSTEAVHTSRQVLADVDDFNPHAELHVHADTAENVEGSGETELLVPGDEHDRLWENQDFDVTSETGENLHHKPSSRSLRMQPSENTPVVPYNNSDKVTGRISGLKINTDFTKMPDTHTREAFTYPPDGHIPTLDANPAIRIADANATSFTPSSITDFWTPAAEHIHSISSFHRSSSQSIRSGSQKSNMTTWSNQSHQSHPSDSLSSARATLATSTTSRRSTTGPRTTLVFETGSRTPSEVSLLNTPSSLAPSVRQTSSYTSIPAAVSSQQHSRKNGLFGLFRKKITLPRPITNTTTVSSPAKAPVTPAPISTGRSPNSNSEPFTPFRYLTSKRYRTVSSASIEAQDGTQVYSEHVFSDQLQSNVILESPTLSVDSQPPIQAPPLRDPILAIQEWIERETTAAPSKVRRTRPGVVFDVAEDPPDNHRPRLRRNRSSAGETF